MHRVWLYIYMSHSIKKYKWNQTNHIHHYYTSQIFQTSLDPSLEDISKKHLGLLSDNNNTHPI